MISFLNISYIVEIRSLISKRVKIGKKVIKYSNIYSLVKEITCPLSLYMRIRESP